jgi:hypothetical protein
MKKLLAIIVIILLLTGALIYYLYTRISYTPEWYADHQYDVSSQMILQSKGTTSKINDELSKNKRSIIDEKELNDFILEKIHDQIPEKSDQVVKALRSEVSGDKIVIESVINLDEIPFKNLSPKYQSTVKKFLGSFPEKSRQNFYVRISGKPIRTNDHIELDEGAKVQLGKMEYPVKAILKQISGENQVETFVPLNELPFTNIHLEDDKIVLEN